MPCCCDRTGDWRTADTCGAPASEYAARYHHRACAQRGTACPPSAGRADHRRTRATACKPAHDGRGYIVRLVDRYGRGGEGELIRQGQPLPVACRPNEVHSWRLQPCTNGWRAEPHLIERRLVGALVDCNEPHDECSIVGLLLDLWTSGPQHWREGWIAVRPMGTMSALPAPHASVAESRVIAQVVVSSAETL